MVSFHGIFNPAGDSSGGRKALTDLWIEAQEQIEKNRDREMAREEKEWEQLSKAINKLTPLITEVLQGGREANEVVEYVSELVPELELRRKVFDWYSEIFNRKPEDSERERAELLAAKQAQEARTKLQRNNRAVLNAFTRLTEAVEADEPGAADALLDAANTAAAMFSITFRRHPERFKKAAESNAFWPVLADTRPGWEKNAADEISRLELGKNLSRFTTRLRKLRGSDIHLPGRRWAKAAVSAIDETRWRLPFFVHMVNELGGHNEWAEFAVNRGWAVVDCPSWISSAMKLKPFSVTTYDNWKVVVREIIRDQVPDFHLLSEWATQRATAEANGKGSAGEIQNAILDDIVSALKRFAPEATC